MDISVSQMMQMQKRLHAANADKWSPMEPEYARNSMLYMIEEVGESIAVLKKKGEQAIVNDPEVRKVFCEEMADVLMYYMDTLLRFQITPEELSEAYTQKHYRNMGRDYTKEYKELYHHGEN